MKTTMKMIVLLASIGIGCASSPQVQDDETPSSPPGATDTAPCQLANPAVAPTPQVASEPYLLRVPESDKRELKANAEHTAAALAPTRVDAAVLASQAEYLKRARALADGYSGTKDKLDAELSKLKGDLLAPR